MKSPADDEIDNALRRLEETKMEIVDDVDDADDAPRWQSDAEREGLPVVNVTDTGAPLLRTDDVLRWEPSHIGRK